MITHIAEKLCHATILFFVHINILQTQAKHMQDRKKLQV